MKIKVLKEFRDVTNYAKQYSVGDELVVDKERGERIVKLQLGEEIKENVRSSRSTSGETSTAETAIAEKARKSR